MAGRSVTRASPELSVVVPAYNVPPALIQACLRSVQRQDTALRTEIVVVDDGSRRDSAASAQAFCARANLRPWPVQYVGLTPHVGMAHARNAGVAAARGEYALLLDADDTLPPGALGHLTDPIRSGTASLIFGDHANVDEHDRKITAVRRKDGYAAALRRWRGTGFDPFLHATFLIHPQVFRRATYLALGGLRTDLGYGDEIPLHIAVSQRQDLGDIIHIPEVLYRYRNNPQSVVHQSAYYHRLIRNIERELLQCYSQFNAAAVHCRRSERGKETLAAHYAFYDVAGTRIQVPWYDSASFTLIATDGDV